MMPQVMAGAGGYGGWMKWSQGMGLSSQQQASLQQAGNKFFQAVDAARSQAERSFTQGTEWTLIQLVSWLLLLHISHSQWMSMMLSSIYPFSRCEWHFRSAGVVGSGVSQVRAAVDKQRSGSDSSPSYAHRHWGKRPSARNLPTRSINVRVWSLA